ncbi:MAG: prepilin-type N-terminal cleavage/methylation domain-containing protein [Candidatus Aureabacteria bacterium]|nr:prepilin-type N-terminal cleavage/methylation domain-containing protein [Candidatus Auribacterota bacterium]
MKDKKQNFRGFTIIEMIAVMAIIAILMGIILPIMGVAKKKALAAKAKIMIESIGAAIKMYEMDFGDLPPDADVTGDNHPTEPLYSYLTTPWTTANASIYAGPYIEFKGDVSIRIGVADSEPDGKYEIVDPWGNEYHYESDDDNGAGGDAPYRNIYSFDIYSAGPDEDLSTAADNITNWE